ncbi:putative MFS family arabinose efflux permease [Lentzea atacamensis]|uniref:MFS family arabinose efflux permease n=1 Tax=Lentzea atacamensis TaxID=531938 RepID=A0ABX9E6K0_9PSEU|nr:putative MFS family arabinose efflux permease [Lentzea atacamensis]
MSLAAALGTSTLYPLQPAIADVAHSMGAQITAVGVALACGPAGYMAGLGLLVPLVDRFAPSRVLSAQFGVLAAVLAASAVAGGVVVLGALTGLVGACSAVGAGLSSVAGRLAPENRRATVLGIVTAGISAGILTGRIAGGWLTDEIGWRATLLVFATACALVAAGCLLLVPPARSGTALRYGATLRSLPGLFARHAVLRGAATGGALWFFAFCALWSGLAVVLSQPPYSYSAERIGLYALAGVSGVLATRVAGAWTDRAGARRVILVGLAVAGVAAAVMACTLASTAATIVCLPPRRSPRRPSGPPRCRPSGGRAGVHNRRGVEVEGANLCDVPVFDGDRLQDREVEFTASGPGTCAYLSQDDERAGGCQDFLVLHVERVPRPAHGAEELLQTFVATPDSTVGQGISLVQHDVWGEERRERGERRTSRATRGEVLGLRRVHAFQH